MDTDKTKEDLPMVVYWEGRPATELTKEELIQALDTMGKLYEQSIENARRDRELLIDMFGRK